MINLKLKQFLSFFQPFSFIFLLFGVVLFCNLSKVLAADYTSPNFILRDPVIVSGGTISASANFQYFSSDAQPATGQNISPNFIYRAGFLYFPTASTPSLSAMAGDSQVSLSWTASVGALANITGYDIGTSTVSGGPYVFETVGDTLSFVKTGLNNGTTYFFIVRAYAGSLLMAQSAQVAATPASLTGQNPIGGAGPSVTFSGLAYPEATITLLKDGQVAVSGKANSSGNFTVNLTNLSMGNYLFSLYATDAAGRNSALYNFPLFISGSSPVSIEGVFIAPTIAVDKSEVRQGDEIIFFGQSAPNAEIIIVVVWQNGKESIKQTLADSYGNYSYSFNTSELARGIYSVKTAAKSGKLTSRFGLAADFTVGDENIIKKPKDTCPKADLNKDCRVNLVDISILIYWFNKNNFPAYVDLSNDGYVNLTDLSIMAYYWTG